MLYMMEWSLKADGYDKAHNRFLNRDFRFASLDGPLVHPKAAVKGGPKLDQSGGEKLDHPAARWRV